MASSMILPTIVVATLFSMAAATDYIVGAPGGTWDLTTNYTTWVASKNFHIGDNLIFCYEPSMHTVVEVGKADYDGCTATCPIATYTDGNTVIPLTSAATRYFICTIPGHCDAGMKIQIDVSSHAPPRVQPTGSASGRTVPRCPSGQH